MITIVQRVLDDVLAHAREDEPRECCGLLLGSGRHVTDSLRARNLASGSSRFQIDPRDHFDAIRQARAAAQDVVGFYHSHPRSAPFPSATDMAESGYADAMHLIVGVGLSGHEARMFTIGSQAVVELELAVVP